MPAKKRAKPVARAAKPGASKPPVKKGKAEKPDKSSKVRVLVLHGPNLNLLGEREPEIYGTLTLSEIDARIRDAAAKLGIEVGIRQSNHEGDLVDYIHGARKSVSGIIVNPGAYSHTSLAIADAIRAVNLPAIEVHISNVFAREEERQRLVIAPACVGVVSGLGWRGYVSALQALVELLPGRRRTR